MKGTRRSSVKKSPVAYVFLRARIERHGGAQRKSSKGFHLVGKLYKKKESFAMRGQ
jgi:hypothetical protein